MTMLLGIASSAEWAALGKLLGLLGLDLLFAGVVIHLIYHRQYRNREYVFTYYALNVITFSVCAALSNGSAQIGLGLALFGVFGILRYRTEQIRIRDLTYLFVVIGLGVLTGVGGHGMPLVALVVVETVIVSLTALLESGPRARSESSTPMLYDQLELLRPGNEARLQDDLAARIGLQVLRVELVRVDLLRDAAEIIVFHRRN